MITLDWTKNDKPWIDEGNYYYNYVTIINPNNYSNDSYQEKYLDGLRELLSYYNKKEDSTLIDNIKEGPYLFDPRSDSCSHAYYLVSLPIDYLDSLMDLPFEIPQGVTPVRMTLDKFYKSTSKYGDLMRSFSSYLSKNDLILTNSSNEQKISSGIFNSFRETIKSLLTINKKSINPSLKIEFFFSETYFIDLVIYDNEPMLVGRNLFSKDKSTRNILVNGCFANKQFVDSFILDIKNKDKFYDWELFISNIKGVYNLKIEKSTSIVSAIKNALEDGPVVNLAKDYKDAALKTYKDLLDPVRIDVGTCGMVDENYINNIVKNNKLYNIENELIANQEMRINVLDYLTVNMKSSSENSALDGYDFVGDRILADFLDNKNYPRSLDEVYRNILNYVRVDDLLKKSLECLDDVSIPKICIDVYSPLVFDFPDRFSISGVFDNISDLILSQILFIIQEAIMALMRQILKIIEECEFEDLKTLGQKDDSLFIDGNLEDNLPIVNKLLENYDDFQQAKELALNQFKDFAEEVYKTLLPTEFCSLINATPTDKTMAIVKCILDLKFNLLKTKLDTDEKIISSFVIMRSFFNSSVCDIGKFVPSGDEDICNYTDLEYLKDNFVSNMPKMSKDELESQIKLIQEIKNNKLNYFSNLLFNGDKSSVVFEGKTPEEFATDNLPCAADNDNMRHIVGVVIDSMLNSVNTIFVDAAAGSFSNSEYFSTQNGRVNYINKITAPEFVNRTNPHSINIGNLILKQNVGSSVLILSTPAGDLEVSSNLAQGASDEYWREEEFKTFPYLKIRKVDSNQTTIDIDTSGQPVDASNVVDSGLPNVSISQLSQISANFGNNNNINLDQSRQILEEFFIERIIKIISSTPLMLENAEVTKQILSNTISDGQLSPIIFNCWDGQLPVRQGIISKYLEEECKTKNSDSLNTSISTGIVDLYIRSVITQIAYNNFLIAGDIGFNNLNKSFTGDFIIKKLEKVLPYIPDTFIEDYDTLLSNNLQQVTTTFKSALGNYATDTVDRPNNIHYLLLESIPVFDRISESLIRTSLSKLFFIKESTNGQDTMSLYISLLDTGNEITIGQISTVTLPTGSSTTTFHSTIIASENYKLMFDFCFPIKDYVSVFSIYNLFNLGLNSDSWNQIYDLLLYSLDGVRNVNNFTYSNDTMVTKERVKMSRSRKRDGRSDVTRFLSLPWIFDFIL